MPFGDTAKKLQKVTSMAEDLYEKMNELFVQLNQLRERVDETTEQVESIESDLAEQRALVEAVAEHQGLDVNAIVEEATGEDGDADATDAAGGDPDATDAAQ